MSEFEGYNPYEEEIEETETSFTDENNNTSWGIESWVDFNVSSDYGSGLYGDERFKKFESKSQSRIPEDSQIKRIKQTHINHIFGNVEAQGIVDKELVIWTDQNIVFVHEYDGWESLKNLPRHPKLDYNREALEAGKIAIEESPREGLSKESFYKMIFNRETKTEAWPADAWRDFYIVPDYGCSHYLGDGESRFDLSKIEWDEDDIRSDKFELVTKEQIEEKYGTIEAQGFIDGVMTIWTDKFVIYVLVYDGAEQIQAYPRNPINISN